MLSEEFYQDYERLTGQKWNLLRGGKTHHNTWLALSVLGQNVCALQEPIQSVTAQNNYAPL